MGILKKLNFRGKELDDFKAPSKLRSLGGACGVLFPGLPGSGLVSSSFAVRYSAGLLTRHLCNRL